MRLESDVFQIIPPLFQPLRLWTPRVPPVCCSVPNKVTDSENGKKTLLRTFSMRGGLVNTADGERRLMIAGKMFRNLE
jgi:hypothetical protein